MEFTNAIKYGFKNYANFKGVIDRRTFWWWYLFTVAVSFGVMIISAIAAAIIGGSSAYILDGTYVPETNGLVAVFNGFANLVLLALALPTLALEVRRLRDVGTNPLVLLFGLIPGFIAILGSVIGGAIGAANGSYGFDSLAYAAIGAIIGMVPGLLLALGFGIWIIILLAKPTKTAAQGNKYAVA